MYFWTKEQLSILNREYPLGNIEKIVSETGKKKSAVIAQAKRLKIFIKPTLKIWLDKVPLETSIYLSGHFDGEGCIRFRKKHSRLTRTPIVEVQICNLETLKLYHKYFSGKIREIKTSMNKQMYKWTCTKYEDIYNFILSIIPYSIEKKEQLLCIKEFLELVLKNGKGLHFTDEFRDKAIELHERCTQLKKVG